MNNIFKIVSTVLMIMLMLILIWVLVSYYIEDEPVSTISPGNVENVLDTNVEIQENEDKDEIDENVVPDENEVEENTEMKDTENQNNELPSQVTEQINNTDANPVIIQSSEQISNAEKQEVLTEIDRTLMELLQVVDKVQPVDESRLGIEESEVQP